MSFEASKKMKIAEVFQNTCVVEDDISLVLQEFRVGGGQRIHSYLTNSDRLQAAFTEPVALALKHKRMSIWILSCAGFLFVWYPFWRVSICTFVIDGGLKVYVKK